MTLLACTVVFCTLYALIHPAITLETAVDGLPEQTQVAEAPSQGDLQMVLPGSAQIPAGYNAEYAFIDPDDRFGVKVYAPEGALPENAVLSAALLDANGQAYAAAEQALAETDHDGFAAMDIRFLLDGEEVEPESGVYVCLNVMGLLPEGADEASLAVQHHRQSDVAPLASDEEEAPVGVTVETVADAAQALGQVEAVGDGDGSALDVAAAFAVESFSTFTVTWQDSYKLILNYVDADGTSIYAGESETALATYSALESVTLSQYANRISHTDHAYDYAYVLVDGVKTAVTQVWYNKDEKKWQYAATDGSWTDWLDGTNRTANVYLSYKPRVGNEIVTPENNIYPVDAINVWDENANVILIYPHYLTNTDLSATVIRNLHDCIPAGFPEANTSQPDWTVYRIEKRGDNGRYQVLQKGSAHGTTGVQVNDSYLLLVKNSYLEKYHLYIPTADWPESHSDTTLDGSGDTVQVNLLCSNTKEQSSTGSPLAYLTFSPKTNAASAAARPDDAAAVQDDAIHFRLFDYSDKINRPNGGGDSWRQLVQYFQFRGAEGDVRSDLKNGNTDNRYDEDGFTVNHATVERVLDENGYPVLDPNRNALGEAKSPMVTDADLPRSERSLAYLFGGTPDSAVTAYDPVNTILQKSGSRYYYNSRYNAVDYDITNKLFRVRSYSERNSSTSTYGNAQAYYDFLPFNYTGGQVVGTTGADGRTYNLADTDVNYWFGMRMDVEFYQDKNGMLGGEDMIFRFTGDDDVWVFIDDVLVLDLGGTHGAVSGSINFATGEIQQYLDWNGVTGEENVTSFPTTLKACYTAAGENPNGGWNGNIFSDYSKHKLSFFYMERGCAVANCAIDFNLPTRPIKPLQVTKTLEAADSTDPDAAAVVKHLENTMEYKFRVVKADADGKPTDALLVKEGDTYTLSSAGSTENETRTVGANGYFTLKPGQTAEFADMLARFADTDGIKKYVVQEVLPTGLTGQYHDVAYEVDDGTNTCKDDTTLVGTDFIGYNSPPQGVDTGNWVIYTNEVDTEKLSTLAIKKEQVGGSLSGDPAYYYMKVQLGPSEDSLSPIAAGMSYEVGGVKRAVEKAGIIKLAAGETARLKLLAGTCYKVEEVADEDGNELTGSEEYTPTYTNDTSTITEVGSTVTVTVKNTFPTGDLELTKIVNNTSGGSTDGEFTFEIKFPVGVNWKDTSYAAAYTSMNSGSTHTGDALPFTKEGDNAVATVNLYHGETVAITGLPAGAQVTIAETNSDGYSVGWKVGDQESYAKAVTTPIVADQAAVVVCTNTTGYALPNTGGAGTVPYAAGGLLLTSGAAFLLLYNHTRRRKEDAASS